MAKNIQRGRLIGLHVYTDERGRDIFYNVFDKRYWIYFFVEINILHDRRNYINR